MPPSSYFAHLLVRLIPFGKGMGTPLVDQYQPDLGLTVLLGPMVLRCLGRPYSLLWHLPALGVSQLTEYLSFGHSYGVCLRQRQRQPTSYGGASIVVSFNR